MRSAAVLVLTACAGAGKSPLDQAPVWTQVAAGYRFVCALDDAGRIACTPGMGDDDGEPGPPLGTFAAISAGCDHACGLDAVGVVSCWGSDTFEQVSAFQSLPVAEVTAMCKGTCVVGLGGAIACAGIDSTGIEDEPEVQATHVGGKLFAGCTLDSTGANWCWGQEPDDSTYPEQGRYTSLQEIVPAYWWTMVIDDDGQVREWTAASGSGHLEDPEPIGTGWHDLVADQYAWCAMRDGEVACAPVAPSSPEIVPPSREYVGLSAALSSACGLTSEGEVVCWTLDPGLSEPVPDPAELAFGE